MSFTGEIGSKEPIAAGVPVSDLNAGLFGALADAGGAATIARRRARDSMSRHRCLEAALAYTVWETGKYLTTGEVAEPTRTRAHRLAAPYEALRTKDGHMVVGVNSQRLWEKFCRALGDAELKDDPLFAKKYDAGR